MKLWKKQLAACLLSAACMASTCAAFPTAASTMTEIEPNDLTDTANALPVNTTMTGNLYENGDEDYYQITLPEAGSLSLTFAHPTLSSSSGYWRGTLMDANGTALCAWDSAGNQAQLTTETLGLAAGTYYVKVRAGIFQYDASDYTLTANYTAQEDQTQLYEQEGANDTVSDALTLPIDTSVIGNIHASDDTDYYQFQLHTRSKVSISFQHAQQKMNSTYWNIAIVDQNGKTVKIWTSSGKETSMTTDAVNLDAGTYYVKVTAGSLQSADNYTMQVTAKATGNTAVSSLRGDVDGDKEITIQDAYLTLMAYSKTSAGLDAGLTSAQKTAADVDQDDAVTITDAYQILLYYATKSAGGTPSWD